ncbi:DUF3592 domain-containing protein [Iodobacter sp. CM08]|uniref:DUF3592 domain-containing protein n=1 Tax=Iodobacter sp. CM08 TaxID=3085902 RepID=UPI0029822D1D|nr:DUF3592 domain-containing protein [Iodobacter sp. CM08]MDW5417088.1 DUF3592 domain-containing protein [Iodobacter sp. CM08]
MRKIKKHVLDLYSAALSIFLFIGGCAAIYFSSGYVHLQWQAYQSQNWPHTTAIVEKIDFISSKHKNKTFFVNQINYQYLLADQAYRGEYESGRSDTLVEQQQQWAEYSVGSTLSVAYQPSNPSAAFTRFDQFPWWLHAIKGVGVLLLSMLLFVLGGVAILSTMGITYKERRPSKRERAESQRVRVDAIARKKTQGKWPKKA